MAWPLSCFDGRVPQSDFQKVSTAPYTHPDAEIADARKREAEIKVVPFKDNLLDPQPSLS